MDLKYSKFKNNDIIKKYDEFIFTLSLSEKLNFIKRSFLKNEYKTFFSLYNLIETNEIKKIENINSMYIQNLYQSNQFDVAINVLEMISSETITDELLLYRIKTNIKLAEFKGARNDIKLFEKTFQDSELLRYIRYEKKLLDNKNEK
jgi:hypothetical protein